MNCLILSHFFYPYANVGAKRMTALAIYLLKKHNRVYVIHANKREYGDSILTNELPCRIPTKELRKHYDNLFVGKITRNSLYWEIIDPILKRKKIDMIFISGGPFNYFGLIPKIKKKYPSIKCVLDIRDVLDGRETTNDKVSFLYKLNYFVDRITEKKAVRAADVCMTVTNSMNQLYKKRYPMFADKFYNIQNGYDDITVKNETIERIRSFSGYGQSDRNQLVVGVFGKYGTYDQRFYEILANAVQYFYKNGNTIIIKQFGILENGLVQALKNRNLSELYQYIPTCGYDVDILELQKCDVTIASNFLKEALGTKIFDYIWINRPIIIINYYDDSEQAKIIKQFKNGLLCHDENGLINAFSRVMALYEKKLDDKIKAIDKYSRSNQFDKLFKLIEQND